MTTFTVTSSTDVVNSSDDATVFTLREAIEAADANGTGADEIVFAGTLAGSTIRLTSGVLTIVNSSVSINGDTNGDGNPDIIISGDKTGDGKSGDDTGILVVSFGATASLSSLQLSGGYGRSVDGYGAAAFGAIYNVGTLAITDSIISNNYARGGNGLTPGVNYYANGERGGDAAAGILNNSTGTLTVTETAFVNNLSIGGTGGTGSTENTYAGHYNGGDGGNAGVIINAGTATSNNVGFLAGNQANAGYGGDGGGNTTGNPGGTGGNGGHGAAGILNTGILSGDAGLIDGSYIQAFGGTGGAGTPNGAYGNDGLTGYTFLNLGGTVAGFTDLGIVPFSGVTSGNDTITGSGSNDLIIALTGNDTIRGGYSDDTIYAGAGNDTIIVEGSQYFDTVHGGSGVDTLDHSASTYVGVDTFNFQAGTQSFTSTFQGILTVSGIEIFKDSNSSNIITTSALGMSIFGNGGDDQITGLGGIDTIDSGDGDDTVEGGLGNDVLIGGANTAVGDTVSFANFVAVSGTLGITVDMGNSAQQNTGAGLDTISGFENVKGSAFDDTITHTNGTKNVNGMDGNDTIHNIVGLLIGSVLNGGNDTDTLVADLNFIDGVVLNLSTGFATYRADNYDQLISIENVTVGGATGVIGDGFNNVITVTQTYGAGTNTIDGGGGDDTIEGGQGADILAGGAHGLFGDTVSYSLSTAGVTVNIATQTASLGDAGGDTLSGFENATGSALADTLTGSSAANVLKGLGGNDTILGGAGADNMDGGDGIGDTVSYAGSTSVNINLFTHAASGGHATGDTISNFENVIGTSQSDVIAGDGNANVLSGALGTGDMITYANSNAFVNVNLTTNVVSGGFAQGDTISGFERVIGSAFDDFLAGTVFANQMAGGNGNDTVFGDAGADNLTGGNGFDTLDYTTSAGGVTINLLTNASSGGNAQGDIIGSFERVNGSSGGVDVLTGNTAVNILRGNGGNDFIEGGAGGDTLDGGAGSADTLVYTSSNAAVIVNIGLNTASGGHAQLDIISGFERLTGSDFGDTLTGTTGTNILKGGLGNDSLTGGAGFDTFVFDTAIGAANIDSITDFSVPLDTIQLDNLIFTALTDGALDATLFGFAATADTSDRIIYDQATAQLFYDTNGSDPGSSTQIATLATGLAMTAADFFVI